MRPPSREPSGSHAATSFRAAGRAVGREIADSLEQHPEPERLIAYAEKQLDAAAHEAVADHLAACPACTEMVRDYLRFDALGDDPDSPVADPERAAAGWRAVRAALADDSASADDGASELAEVVPLARPVPATAVPPPARHAGRMQLAAMLAVGLGIGWLLAARLAPGPVAEANVPLAVLEAQSATRGPTIAPAVVSLPPGAEYFTLVLSVLAVDAADAYDAVLETATGGFVDRFDELWPQGEGIYRLLSIRLPAPPSGDYRLQVVPRSGGGEPRVYVFRLVAGGS